MLKFNNTLLISFCFILFSGFIPGKKTKIYKDKEEAISIELPKTWHSVSLKQGNYSSMFISFEEIKKKGDLYATGVSITKIRSMSKTYSQVKNDADIVKLWYGAIKMVSQKHYLNEEVNFENLKIGEFKGIIVETILQPTENTYASHMYQAILAYNDDLYTLTLECPAQDWETYQPIFESAIASAVIK
ncbi:MAG: photosystem II reaction center PsbP family protein [Bacteroidota bacterium]|nr:photosystem II reaction center PsbP family protein [Bacteroidota bacterium]